MKEWIDPKYADLVAAMRRAQKARRGTRPVRGFVIPRTPS